MGLLTSGCRRLGLGARPSVLLLRLSRVLVLDGPSLGMGPPPKQTCIATAACLGLEPVFHVRHAGLLLLPVWIIWGIQHTPATGIQGSALHGHACSLIGGTISKIFWMSHHQTSPNTHSLGQIPAYTTLLQQPFQTTRASFTYFFLLYTWQYDADLPSTVRVVCSCSRPVESMLNSSSPVPPYGSGQLYCSCIVPLAVTTTLPVNPPVHAAQSKAATHVTHSVS